MIGSGIRTCMASISDRATANPWLPQHPARPWPLRSNQQRNKALSRQIKHHLLENCALSRTKAKAVLLETVSDERRLFLLYWEHCLLFWPLFPPTASPRSQPGQQVSRVSHSSNIFRVVPPFIRPRQVLSYFFLNAVWGGGYCFLHFCLP
jgi:hypothetical protein